MFAAVPIETNEVKLLVVPAVNLTVFGALMVNVLNELVAPVISTEPDPPPEIVKFPYFKPDPAKILLADPVSEITIFELVPLKVVSDEAPDAQMFSADAEVNVHVPLPISRLRAVDALNVIDRHVTFLSFASNVPFANVKVKVPLEPVKLSCNTNEPPTPRIVTDPAQEKDPLVHVELVRVSNVVPDPPEVCAPRLVVLRDP